MNRKFFGIILSFVFLISALFLYNTVDAADPVLSIYTSEIKSTSVTFVVSGLKKDQNCLFALYNIDEGRKLVEQKPLIGNSLGDAPVSFIELSPNTSYTAEVKDLFGKTYSVPFIKTLPSENDLNGIISIVNQRLEDPSIVEGTKVGEYKVGSRAILENELKYAEGFITGVGKPSQADINNTARDLRAALDTFELSKITATKTGTDKGSKDPDIALMENGGIVPRCNIGGINMQTGQYNVPCDFNFFIDLINRVIKFLLFVIATPLVAIILMYTGYLYISAGGNSGQVEKVKHILFNAVIGYVIALAAWLIVNTIVTSLNIDPSINTFMDKIQK